MRFQNKTVLVTGGALGIGRGIARSFAREGGEVWVADIDDEEGRRTVEEIVREGGRARYVHMNVANESDIQAVFAALPQLDVLVNNAGAFPAGSLESLPSELWDLTIDVSLKSVFLCSKYALPLIKRSGRGAIVNIASVNAHVTAPGLPAYAAAKGGMIALSRQIAVEYAPQGIRVNSVSPGFILTEHTEKILEDPLERDMTVECYPVGRLGTVDDVANAVLFLASEQAGFINGADLLVDGGMSAMAVGAVIKPVLRQRWKTGEMRLERHHE